ncbi:MAG: hypothetical protein R3Y35_11495 [Clostridia bacterium]
MKNEPRIPIAVQSQIGDYEVINCVCFSSSSILYTVINRKSKRRYLLKEYYPYDLAKNKTIYYNSLIDSIQSKDNEDYYHGEYKKEIKFVKQTEYINEELLVIDNKEYILIDIDDGQVLLKYMNERDSKGKIKGIDTLNDVTQLFINILKGVEPIHNNKYIHGNISPSNLFLITQEDKNICQYQVKALDLTDIFPININNKKEGIIGKDNHYSPLEYRVSNKKKCITYGSDIYSIAAIIFEILFDCYFDLLICTERKHGKIQFAEFLSSPYFDGADTDTINKLKEVLLIALIYRYKSCAEAIKKLS